MSVFNPTLAWVIGRAIETQILKPNGIDANAIKIASMLRATPDVRSRFLASPVGTPTTEIIAANARLVVHRELLTNLEAAIRSRLNGGG